MENVDKLFGSLLVLIYHCCDPIVISGYPSGCRDRLREPLIFS